MTPAERAAIKTRAEKAWHMMANLCKPKGQAGAREWVMSIPARPDVDPDLVIGAALCDIPKLLAEVEQLHELLGGLTDECPIKYGYDGDPECAYCGGTWYDVRHGTDCPWWRARQYLVQEDQ